MIPKIIHYCWFGGNPLPEDVKVYIDSWKKYLPEFEIKKWDETNFDVNARIDTREAYYARKFAFVSDVARLEALYEEGGLYLDTDILIKKEVPREWFEREGFAGFEHDEYVGTGIIACTPKHPIIRHFLDIYEHIHYYEGLRFSLTTNVRRFTDIMKAQGFIMSNQRQELNGFLLFPQIVLCGKDWQKGRYDTDETIMFHDFQSTWGQEYLKHKYKYHLKMLITIIKWHLGGKNTKFNTIYER